MVDMEKAMVGRRFEAQAGRRGFTLIELLVVVAIIALLISILLPSLQGARKSARATVCATNLHHVSQAVNIYLAENNAVYPPSYVYAFNGQGSWDPQDQPANVDFGYVHWSWMLYSRGQAGDTAFQCPDIPNGGHTRTFPGPDAANWEGGQVDRNGGTVSATSIEDKQARRLAFTANAAIMPRNKFSTNLAEGEDSGDRLNIFVRETAIKSPRPVVLATEFQQKFPAVCLTSTGSGNSLISRAHRPINPFFNIQTDSNEYSAPADRGTIGTFVYKSNPNEPDTPQAFRLAPQTNLNGVAGLIEGEILDNELNAVGRHHPGGDKLGGTTNFLYVDGSVARKTIYSTLENREWGNRFWSLDFAQIVLDLEPQPSN